MKQLTFLACGMFALSAGAQSLDGRSIKVEGGNQPAAHVPISLPYDGPDIATNKLLVAPDGKQYPATIREGELVFVLDALGANETVTLSVAEGREPPHVKVGHAEGEQKMSVRFGDTPFTDYVYEDKYKKPFLWPILGEDGTHLTRDYPMERVGRSRDHIHHKSFWTAYGEVDEVDLWAEGSNSGQQVVKNVDGGSGDAYGWIRSENVWVSHDGEPAIDETREYRFYNTADPGVRFFDTTVTFTASYRDVTFRDTKEGGIVSLRIRPEIEGNRNGVITNAAGGKGEKECWGKPAAWCDYSGEIEGVGQRGIAIFDHPNNLRHPTHWHVRDYGLMGANCFGYSHFTRGEKNGDYTFKEGDTLTFNYRTYVHSGDVETANVAARYADYANPPKAQWAG